jgi:hypothetical protein
MMSKLIAYIFVGLVFTAIVYSACNNTGEFDASEKPKREVIPVQLSVEDILKGHISILNNYIKFLQDFLDDRNRVVTELMLRLKRIKQALQSGDEGNDTAAEIPALIEYIQQEEKAVQNKYSEHMETLSEEYMRILENVSEMLMTKKIRHKSVSTDINPKRH